MKTISDLTPEILNKIPEYISKAVDKLYSGEEHTTNKREDTVEYIKTIYEIIGKKKPIVIIADDPIRYRFMFNKLFNTNLLTKLLKVNNKELNSEELNNKLNAELDSELNKELDNELRDKLSVGLSKELDNELGNKLDSKLYSALSKKLYNELGKKLSNELSVGLSKELKPVKSHWIYLCSIYSRAYLTWYYFISKEFNIKLKNPKKQQYLEKLYSLINKTFISRCYFTENVVLVLRTPSRIIRNENSLHSVNSAAVQFKTGYGMYYINGRKISKTLFDRLSKNEVTFEEFIKEDNEDIKSAILAFIQEKYGAAALFKFISSSVKEVDTYTNIKPVKYLEGTTNSEKIGVYTLFKGNIKNVGSVRNLRIAYIRCYCPSTDRIFFLGVESKHNNAKDAIASLYRVPLKLRNEINYIQRQGERFSTVFTKKGRLIQETMCRKDYIDTISIGGNEYFEKLRYEY